MYIIHQSMYHHHSHDDDVVIDAMPIINKQSEMNWIENKSLRESWMIQQSLTKKSWHLIDSSLEARLQAKRYCNQLQYPDAR